MKVKVDKTVRVRATLDLATRDIQVALTDELRDVVDSDGARRVLRKFINDAHCCLAAVPSSIIAAADWFDRKTVAKMLREQADRWDRGR